MNAIEYREVLEILILVKNILTDRDDRVHDGSRINDSLNYIFNLIRDMEKRLEDL